MKLEQPKPSRMVALAIFGLLSFASVVNGYSNQPCDGSGYGSHGCSREDGSPTYGRCMPKEGSTSYDCGYVCDDYIDRCGENESGTQKFCFGGDACSYDEGYYCPAACISCQDPFAY